MWLSRSERLCACAAINASVCCCCCNVLTGGVGKGSLGNAPFLGEVRGGRPDGRGGSGIAGGGEGREATEADLRRFDEADGERSICWPSLICAYTTISVSSTVIM